MMSSKSRKIISLMLALFFLLMAVPEMVEEAHALVIRYRITWRWRIRRKKTKTRKKRIKYSLTRTKLSTTAGEYEYIYLKKANSKRVKWYSSNRKIATVKRDGKWCEIRTKKRGKVTITARYKGKNYRCRVTVKKKYKKILRCYEDDSCCDKYTRKTIRFKKMKEYSSDKKARWCMYVPAIEDWYDETVLFYNLYKNIYPVTITFNIKNPKIVDGKWKNYDSVSDGWTFKMIPKKPGKTTLTITNSYNKQKFKYTVIVEEGVGVECPDEDDDYDHNDDDNDENENENYPEYNSLVELDEEYLTLMEGETKSVYVKTDKGFDVGSDYDGDSVSCELGKMNYDHTATLNVTGLKEGTTDITVYDIKNDKAAAVLHVTVKAKKTEVTEPTIIPEKDVINVRVGETETVAVQIGSDIDKFTCRFNKYLVTCSWGNWIRPGVCELYITGIEESSYEIELFDSENESNKSIITVNVLPQANTLSEAAEQDGAESATLESIEEVSDEVSEEVSNERSR